MVDCQTDWFCINNVRLMNAGLETRTTFLSNQRDSLARTHAFSRALRQLHVLLRVLIGSLHASVFLSDFVIVTFTKNFE